MRDLDFERRVFVGTGGVTVTSMAHNDEGQFIISKRVKGGRYDTDKGVPLDAVLIAIQRVYDAEELYKSGRGLPSHHFPAKTRRKFRNRFDQEAAFLACRNDGLTLEQIGETFGYSPGYVGICLRRREHRIRRSIEADLETTGASA